MIKSLNIYPSMIHSQQMEMYLCSIKFGDL